MLRGGENGVRMRSEEAVNGRDLLWPMRDASQRKHASSPPGIGTFVSY